MQEAGISRQVIHGLLALNGGAIAIIIYVFGGMVEQACYMNQAQSLYWFFVSLVVTLLAAQFASWGRVDAETVRHRRICRQSAGGLLLIALALFTAGGLIFLYSLSHNEIVACADADGGDNVQTYGT